MGIFEGLVLKLISGSISNVILVKSESKLLTQSYLLPSKGFGLYSPFPAVVEEEEEQGGMKVLLVCGSCGFARGRFNGVILRLWELNCRL